MCYKRQELSVYKHFLGKLSFCGSSHGSRIEASISRPRVSSFKGGINSLPIPIDKRTAPRNNTSAAQTAIRRCLIANSNVGSYCRHKRHGEYRCSGHRKRLCKGEQVKELSFLSRQSKNRYESRMMMIMKYMKRKTSAPTTEWESLSGSSGMGEENYSGKRNQKQLFY